MTLLLQIAGGVMLGLWACRTLSAWIADYKRRAGQRQFNSRMRCMTCSLDLNACRCPHQEHHRR